MPIPAVRSSTFATARRTRPRGAAPTTARCGRRPFSRAARRRAATTIGAGVSWCIARPVRRPRRRPADLGVGRGVRRREPLPDLSRVTDDSRLTPPWFVAADAGLSI